MAGVVFVFVREDASEVETLAEAFDAAGYSIAGSQNAELSVVIWSRRALRSESFRIAAERALRSGRAIVAALFAPPAREAVFGAPVVDLSLWDGVESAALDPLLYAADDIVHPIEADVIILPSRPVYEDAEFADAPFLIAGGEPDTAKRHAWEAPLPARALRPVSDAPAAEPKLGAPAPRRDFRRVGKRKSHAREHAAAAFLVLAILGGGAFVASVAANTASYAQVERAKAEEGGGVSLTSATAEAVGLQDIAPEAPAQIGHRGVEPPSARSVHRARYEP
jgi:hypothetical protein